MSKNHIVATSSDASAHASMLADILKRKQIEYAERELSRREDWEKEVEEKDRETAARGAKFADAIRKWKEEEERKKAEVKARLEEEQRKKEEAERIKREKEEAERIKREEEARKKAEEEQRKKEEAERIKREREEAERIKREEEVRKKAEEERKKAEAKAHREALKKKKEEEEKALFASKDVEAYVDLGLSVKWATCNIGASMPIEQGDFYAWGEIKPKQEYSWDTYVFYDETHDLNTKYQAKTEVLVAKHLLRKNEYLTIGDDKVTLDKCDDVANKKLQDNWRMPTAAEFRELVENCKWTWTTVNKVKGYKVQSKKKGYTDKCIFLPACGLFNTGRHNYSGEKGCYWSSGLSNDPKRAMCTNFTKEGVDAYDRASRCIGKSIRPVKE